MATWNTVKLNADDGSIIEVRIPASALPTEARAETLRAAFGLVANRDNWKMPIDATIEATDDLVRDIVEGIEFMTCSVATVVTVKGKPGHYRIRAAGYYATVGA